MFAMTLPIRRTIGTIAFVALCSADGQSEVIN
jgi:hypothetical protein